MNPEFCLTSRADYRGWETSDTLNDLSGADQLPTWGGHKLSEEHTSRSHAQYALPDQEFPICANEAGSAGQYHGHSIYLFFLVFSETRPFLPLITLTIDPCQTKPFAYTNAPLTLIYSSVFFLPPIFLLLHSLSLLDSPSSSASPLRSSIVSDGLLEVPESSGTIHIRPAPRHPCSSGHHPVPGGPQGRDSLLEFRSASQSVG